MIYPQNKEQLKTMFFVGAIDEFAPNNVTGLDSKARAML